jgi:hypothetical protein
MKDKVMELKQNKNMLSKNRLAFPMKTLDDRVMELKQKYENMFSKSRLMYPLRELNEKGIFKISTAKKLIANGQLESIKVGSKHFVTRDEIIRYMIENTVSRIDPKDISND